jgi:F-type H+-transporting ATPase subunit beta
MESLIYSNCSLNIMSDSQTKNAKNVGRVVQIIGPVLDIVFAKGNVPNIYNALTITSKNAAGIR